MKRIRRALQELFSTEFEDKKEINELILTRYHELQERKDRKDRKDEQDEPERKKVKAETLKTVTKTATKRRTKKGDADGTPKSKTSISGMELNLSPKLKALLGVKRLPRTQVVKQVWDYIKLHELQNPKDRREILCDDKMGEVFGKKTTMFKLNKALSAHLYKDGE